MNEKTVESSLVGREEEVVVDTTLDTQQVEAVINGQTRRVVGGWQVTVKL